MTCGEAGGGGHSAHYSAQCLVGYIGAENNRIGVDPDHSDNRCGANAGASVAAGAERAGTVCGGSTPAASASRRAFSSAAIAAHLLGRENAPSTAARRAELRARVHEALDCMDPLDREVLALRHFEHLTSAEAAHIRMHLDRLMRDSQPQGAKAGK